MANRITTLDTAWNVYEEWLKYDAEGDGVYKTFEQWLHAQYKKARKENNK